MIKQVKLINKLFGCFVTPVIFRDDEVEFIFKNRDELIIRFEELEKEFDVWNGELYDKDKNFLCYMKELEMFEDFEYKNKDLFYEIGF
jgi:hypothetical protein